MVDLGLKLRLKPLLLAYSILVLELVEKKEHGGVLIAPFE
jgi:hypothetical protein